MKICIDTKWKQWASDYDMARDYELEGISTSCALERKRIRDRCYARARRAKENGNG